MHLTPPGIAMRSVLHTQVHQVGRHRHVVAQVGHDPERARDYDGDHEYAERERQHVVRVVRVRW